jgi:hypothetical protein
VSRNLSVPVFSSFLPLFPGLLASCSCPGLLVVSRLYM